jgi:hypothetical protein
MKYSEKPASKPKTLSEMSRIRQYNSYLYAKKSSTPQVSRPALQNNKKDFK